MLWPKEVALKTIDNDAAVLLKAATETYMGSFLFAEHFALKGLVWEKKCKFLATTDAIKAADENPRNSIVITVGLFLRYCDKYTKGDESRPYTTPQLTLAGKRSETVDK